MIFFTVAAERLQSSARWRQLSFSAKGLWLDLACYADWDGWIPASISPEKVPEKFRLSSGEQRCFDELLEVGLMENRDGRLYIPRFGWFQRVRFKKSRESPEKVPEKYRESPSPVSSIQYPDKEPPKEPPHGGASSSNGVLKPRRGKKPIWQGEIPLTLRVESFEAAWKDWLAYRREELRKPVTQRSGDASLSELASMGPSRASAAIRHTIARGWQGIREEQAGSNGHPKPPAFDREQYEKLKAAAFKADEEQGR